MRRTSVIFIINEIYSRFIFTFHNGQKNYQLYRVVSCSILSYHGHEWVLSTVARFTTLYKILLLFSTSYCFVFGNAIFYLILSFTSFVSIEIICDEILIVVCDTYHNGSKANVTVICIPIFWNLTKEAKYART